MSGVLTGICLYMVSNNLLSIFFYKLWPQLFQDWRNSMWQQNQSSVIFFFFFCWLATWRWPYGPIERHPVIFHIFHIFHTFYVFSDITPWCQPQPQQPQQQQLLISLLLLLNHETIQPAPPGCSRSRSRSPSRSQNCSCSCSRIHSPYALIDQYSSPCLRLTPSTYSFPDPEPDPDPNPKPFSQLVLVNNNKSVLWNKQ